MRLRLRTVISGLWLQRGIKLDLSAMFSDDSDPSVDETRSDDGRVVGDEERAAEETSLARN